MLHIHLDAPDCVLEYVQTLTLYTKRDSKRDRHPDCRSVSRASRTMRRSDSLETMRGVRPDDDDALEARLVDMLVERVEAGETLHA